MSHDDGDTAMDWLFTLIFALGAIVLGTLAAGLAAVSLGVL